MGHDLLNETFIRQRSAELQIPFENLLAASVMEEILRKIAESEYAENFWMKDSVRMNLENYRKKADLSLSFCVKDTRGFSYKKAEVSKVFAELFRNFKKNAIYWNYHVWMDWNLIYIDMTGTVSFIKVPVKIKLEPVLQEKLEPDIRDMRLITNNNRKIQFRCYPAEYVITEKFFEILSLLELLNDMSCYMDIYDILRKEALSGRKVWELVSEGCRKRGIEAAPERFEILRSYRTSGFMAKKWKSYLRRANKKSPSWDEVMDRVESFFSVIWEHICQNIVYLGDWMPELGRFLDS